MDKNDVNTKNANSKNKTDPFSNYHHANLSVVEQKRSSCVFGKKNISENKPIYKRSSKSVSRIVNHESLEIVSKTKSLTPEKNVKGQRKPATRTPRNNPGHIPKDTLQDTRVEDNYPQIKNLLPQEKSSMDLQKELDEAHCTIQSVEEERNDLLKYKNDIRNYLTELMIEKTKTDREAIRMRVNNNRLVLGEIINSRLGPFYESKLIDGSKFRDLEKRLQELKNLRVQSEENRKILNKSKPGNVRGTQPENNMNVAEFFIGYEVNDVHRLNIIKEEKEIQRLLECLERERNSNFREIRRIEIEESSKYNNFPTLENRYLILSILGKSGFSEVYKAFDLDRLCYVACKIQNVDGSFSPEEKEKYMLYVYNEISIHKKLDHQRIVKVYEIFRIENNSFCIVLEYCQGNDLESYLQQKQYLLEREAKSLIAQLVNVLWYLNSNKEKPIIHYNLKPANILLCNDSEVKITDFGLSKVYPDNYRDGDGIELTSFGDETLWYLPPECFDNNAPITVTNKVDVWSVGVIFYQCLYGRKPFGDKMSQEEILQDRNSLHKNQIKFPTDPKVSTATKDFIRRCCTFDKLLRPDIEQTHKDEYLQPKAQLNKFKKLYDNVPSSKSDQ